ncbi:hypothetical protein ABW21_db0207900 [Orbilia brochopaga]|nr:hypothetical protein ABW21_db0207900 [Drechslerella brochopaga]
MSDETLEKRGGYERWARKPELLEVEDGSPFLLGIPRRRKKTSQSIGRRDAANADNRAEKTRITGKPPNYTVSKMPMGSTIKAAGDGVKRKRAPFTSSAGGKMKAAAESRVNKPKQKAGLKGTAGNTATAGRSRKTGGQRRG